MTIVEAVTLLRTLTEMAEHFNKASKELSGIIEKAQKSGEPIPDEAVERFQKLRDEEVSDWNEKIKNL